MRNNSPVKGHHGLGARGQGKPLYFHGQVPEAAIRGSKNQPPADHRQPHEQRQPNGRWAP